MAFLSRLFKRGDPPAEREEARRQGMRDARRHPLTTFTDPESRPPFVAEVRARAREQIAEAGRRLAARRGELLDQSLAAREAILLELSRTDLLPQPPPNGHPGPPADSYPPDSGPSPDSAGPYGGSLARAAGSYGDRGGRPAAPYEEDAFISIAEARWRRGEARRREAVRESQESVQRAGARIGQYAQEWENALVEHDHEVEAVHARAEQIIAAYRSGVMETHPRREEIPPLWQGEVIAMEPTGETRLGISGRDELGRILREVEARVADWHTKVLPHELPPALRLPPIEPPRRTQSPQPPADHSPTTPSPPQTPHSLTDPTSQPQATEPTKAPTPTTSPPPAARPTMDRSPTSLPGAVSPSVGSLRSATAPAEVTYPPAGTSGMAPSPSQAAHPSPDPLDETAYVPGEAVETRETDALTPSPTSDEHPGHDSSGASADGPASAGPGSPRTDSDVGETAGDGPREPHQNAETDVHPGPNHATETCTPPRQERTATSTPTGQDRAKGQRRTYPWREAFGDPSAASPSTPRDGDGEERRWPG